jgi:hypothetical protein
MATSSKRRSRTESKPSGLGPFLVVAATIAGLLVFVPETTSALSDALSAMIALPRF